jgi:hypothetical protein
MIEGSGSGSISLTNGSGSGIPKNIWTYCLKVTNDFRLEDDCPVYTIHLVCRVPDRKHAPSAAAEVGGAARTGSVVGERVGALSGPAETPGQEVQDWMRYMQDLTNNSSSQLSEENLQQVTLKKKIILRNGGIARFYNFL